jgi:hypothetical protein
MTSYKTEDWIALEVEQEILESEIAEFDKAQEAVLILESYLRNNGKSIDADELYGKFYEWFDSYNNKKLKKLKNIKHKLKILEDTEERHKNQEYEQSV